MRTRRRVLLLVRRKHVVTKPAATALLVTKPAATLWLLPLLKSAEIKKLRRARSGHAQNQSHRDSQRNQPTTFGKDAPLFLFLWHALRPHTRRNSRAD